MSERAGIRWAELESRQPRLAELGKQKLGAAGVVLVGTTRSDGAARISPVEPLFWEGDLWLAMGLGSLKAKDLLRDPRILVHSVITSRNGEEGEFKVRGRAVPEEDETLQARFADRVADELGWRPEVGHFHLFRVHVEDVTFIRWVDATGDQYVTRWPAGEEFVRRAKTATSLGRPEPISELLV